MLCMGDGETPKGRSHKVSFFFNGQNLAHRRSLKDAILNTVFNFYSVAETEPMLLTLFVFCCGH